MSCLHHRPDVRQDVTGTRRPPSRGLRARPKPLGQLSESFPDSPIATPTALRRLCPASLRAERPQVWRVACGVGQTIRRGPVLGSAEPVTGGDQNVRDLETPRQSLSGGASLRVVLRLRLLGRFLAVLLGGECLDGGHPLSGLIPADRVRVQLRDNLVDQIGADALHSFHPRQIRLSQRRPKAKAGGCGGLLSGGDQGRRGTPGAS